MRSLPLALLMLALSSLAAHAIERVTLLPDGNEHDASFIGDSLVSADGNLVVFWSSNPEFVDTDFGHWHTYLYDRTGDAFERVSLQENGLPANGNTFPRDMSDDGRFILIESDDDLVSTDTNSDRDVYVRDRTTGETLHASLADNEASPDAACFAQGISNDGRYVIFHSHATNLVSPATSGQQIFLRDMDDETTILVSQSTAGTAANASCASASMSKDGRYVAFQSTANNLLGPGGDTNGKTDIFLRDLEATPTPTTIRVSLTSAGDEISDRPSAEPDISADGNRIVFKTASDEMVPGVIGAHFQVYVRDLSGASTSLVSRSTGGAPADQRCDEPRISSNGRYVAFQSKSDNLAPGSSEDIAQVFVHDLQTDATSRVSVDAAGAVGNGTSGSSSGPADLSDGGEVVFVSSASNLVPDDLNGKPDIFAAPVDAPTIDPPSPPNPKLTDRVQPTLKFLKKKKLKTPRPRHAIKGIATDNAAVAKVEVKSRLQKGWKKAKLRANGKFKFKTKRLKTGKNVHKFRAIDTSGNRSKVQKAKPVGR